MATARQTSFTQLLDAAQQKALAAELSNGNYLPVSVPYATVAAERPDCRIVLYQSGKCVVQGAGAREWMTFVMEPCILGAAALGYESVLDPDRFSPHMGIDESGKGDYFGPMVIAAAFVNAPIVAELERMGVRDSKRITSDRVALTMARDLRRLLKDRHALVTIGPRAYNRLYAKMRSVNQILAWGHARAIENLLELVPDCPRALSDQFGPERQIQKALLAKGRDIRLEQRPKAESDPAVAAASVLARGAFLEALHDLGERLGFPAHKGASPAVETAAADLVRNRGPVVLLDAAKCHFQTTDRVLAAAGHAREALGELGRAVSKVKSGEWRGRRSAPRENAP
ncbi:MAG: ribonuclease HIII [Verrucomicrobia bacterium]|nr:ribonuclease HIII [Verrucomicrobiota bacterium]